MTDQINAAAARVCINALSINYPGRFDTDEIADSKLRKPLNNVCRALDGITAIAKILYSNEIERESAGADAQTLDKRIVYGLCEALVFLAEHGNSRASDLGEELHQQTTGGAR